MPSKPYSKLIVPCDIKRQASQLSGVQTTFHQSLLNSNVTAISANLLLYLSNKVVQTICVSSHFTKKWQNNPKLEPSLARTGGKSSFEGFWENLVFSLKPRSSVMR